MAHHQAARICPSNEPVVLAAVDLHLLLIEAMPEIAGGDADRLVDARGVVDGERRVGQMRRLRLGHGGRHALGGQTAPGRRQFLKRGAIAVELLG